MVGGGHALAAPPRAVLRAPVAAGAAAAVAPAAALLAVATILLALVLAVLLALVLAVVLAAVAALALAAAILAAVVLAVVAVAAPALAAAILAAIILAVVAAAVAAAAALRAPLVVDALLLQALLVLALLRWQQGARRWGQVTEGGVCASGGAGATAPVALRLLEAAAGRAAAALAAHYRAVQAEQAGPAAACKRMQAKGSRTAGGPVAPPAAAHLRLHLLLDQLLLARALTVLVVVPLAPGVCHGQAEGAERQKGHSLARHFVFVGLRERSGDKWVGVIYACNWFVVRNASRAGGGPGCKCGLVKAAVGEALRAPPPACRPDRAQLGTMAASKSAAGLTSD